MESRYQENAFGAFKNTKVALGSHNVFLKRWNWNLKKLGWNLIRVDHVFGWQEPEWHNVKGIGICVFGLQNVASALK